MYWIISRNETDKIIENNKLVNIFKKRVDLSPSDTIIYRFESNLIKIEYSICVIKSNEADIVVWVRRLLYSKYGLQSTRIFAQMSYSSFDEVKGYTSQFYLQQPDPPLNSIEVLAINNLAHRFSHSFYLHHFQVQLFSVNTCSLDPAIRLCISELFYVIFNRALNVA